MRMTAVLVTRGGQSLDAIMKSLCTFDELIVWDNSKAPKDVKVYGRFMGAMLARNEYVYVQDDDCVVDAIKIAMRAVSLFTVTPEAVVCNMPINRRPEYAGTGISLIGWGTVFHRSLIARSFEKYLSLYLQDELFERECDRLFTYVNRSRVQLMDAGLYHLPHAHNKDRMGNEQRHAPDLHEMRRRAQLLES